MERGNLSFNDSVPSLKTCNSKSNYPS